MPLVIISKNKCLRYMRDAQGIGKSSGEKKCPGINFLIQ